MPNTKTGTTWAPDIRPESIETFTETYTPDGGEEQNVTYKRIADHPILNGIRDIKAFFTTHAGAVWYNLLERKTLLAKLTEMDDVAQELAAKIRPDGVVNVYHLNTKNGKEDAVNKLNNPLLLVGKEAPYCILFTNSDGSVPGLSGGVTCIFGYVYTNGLYAGQIGFNFSGLFVKRNKSNGVWSEWTSV